MSKARRRFQFKCVVACGAGAHVRTKSLLDMGSGMPIVEPIDKTFLHSIILLASNKQSNSAFALQTVWVKMSLSRVDRYEVIKPSRGWQSCGQPLKHAGERPTTISSIGPASA